MRQVRAILIDPVTQTCTEVEHDADNYRGIYTLLSDPEHGLNVSCFDVVRLDRGDAIYVDDEGLLKDPKYFFVWKDYPTPLAGRGLILGSDYEGETQSAQTTLDKVRQQITFPQLKVTGFKSEEGPTDWHGHTAWGISTQPLFEKREDKQNS